MPRLDKGRLLFAAPLLVLGLFQSLYLARRADLDCSRVGQQVACELVVGRPLAQQRHSLAPGSVRGVKLEERTTEDNNGMTQHWSRAVLVSTQGDLAVTDWGDGGRDVHAAVRAFLDDPERPTLHVGRDSRWLHGLLGSFWLLAGLFVAFRR